MNRIVFDIETLAGSFEELDEARQEYLMKFAQSDEERSEAIQRLSLYPFTSEIIAIAMLNPDTGRGKVLYQTGGEKGRSTDEKNGIVFVPCDERTIIQTFWNDIIHYRQFITFNGRGFDCPYLLLRSALLGIKPTKNLMPYRYEHSVHCDLLEQLSFYAGFRKFNLDFYCKAFNVKSPKEGGVTGLDLQTLYNEKRYEEIAEYCIGDVIATAELFRIWEAHLKF